MTAHIMKDANYAAAIPQKQKRFSQEVQRFCIGGLGKIRCNSQASPFTDHDGFVVFGDDMGIGEMRVR